MIANLWFASAQPACGCPQFSVDSDARRLRITVVFTTIEGTLAALAAASALARDLGAEIVLLVTEVVSFRYTLDHPPGDWHFFERLCMALLDESTRPNIRTRFEVHFCRETSGCLQQTLVPHSLVLVGARRRCWRSLERDLQRMLLHLGHEVLMVPYSRGSEHVDAVVKRLLQSQTAP